VEWWKMTGRRSRACSLQISHVKWPGIEPHRGRVTALNSDVAQGMTQHFRVAVGSRARPPCLLLITVFVTARRARRSNPAKLCNIRSCLSALAPSVNCCLQLLPAQPFSGPSLAGLMAIFFTVSNLRLLQPGGPASCI
jgi:hypothetical protein